MWRQKSGRNICSTLGQVKSKLKFAISMNSFFNFDRFIHFAAHSMAYKKNVITL